MSIVSVMEGNRPLVLAQPHGGTRIVPAVFNSLNEKGRALIDTDWHIDKVYDGLVKDITVVRSNIHRYVIDVNRSPDNESLYPGQNTTGLCPLTDFDGNPIYQPGAAPDSEEVEHRRVHYHKPYHDALAQQLRRLRRKHEEVILYDCHSIRSQIPFLFEGVLPHFNIGTFNGRSCSNRVEQAVVEVCKNAAGYNTAVNGRFKGGWTTRHYGNPGSGIHAIQMELAQCAYMQEFPPWAYDEKKSSRLRSILSVILETLVNGF